MNSRPPGRPRLYDAEWRRRSRAFLKLHPWCAYHASRGQQVRATIVDHKTPHRGNRALFEAVSNWVSMCKPCHDSAKQAEEKRGHVIGCDENGQPLDPSHRWNTTTPGGPKSVQSRS